MKIEKKCQARNMEPCLCDAHLGQPCGLGDLDLFRRDMALYGLGIMQDGKRIPPVEVFRPPETLDQMIDRHRHDIARRRRPHYQEDKG